MKANHSEERRLLACICRELAGNNFAIVNCRFQKSLFRQTAETSRLAACAPRNETPGILKSGCLLVRDPIARRTMSVAITIDRDQFRWPTMGAKPETQLVGERRFGHA